MKQKTLYIIALSVAIISSLWISRPFVGNFATKPVCYSMIGDNFLKAPQDFLLPRVQMLVSGRPGVHLVEFPWPSYLIAVLHGLSGVSYEILGRAAGILLWLLFLKGMDSLVEDKQEVFYALFSPLTLIYFYSFQMDSWALVGMVFSMVLWNKQRFLAVGLMAMTFLLKPHWIIFFPAMLFFWTTRGVRFEKSSVLRCFIALIPVMAWVSWNFYASGHREDIYFSLAKTAERHHQPVQLWLSASWYFSLAKTLFYKLFNPIGLCVSVIGLVALLRKRSWEASWQWVWLACFLLLVFFIPKKVGEIDYYWLPAVLGVGHLMSCGAKEVTERVRVGGLARFAGAGLTALYLLCSLAIASKVILSVPQSELHAREAGKNIDQHASPQAKVIAISGSSPVLLYYSRREGWDFFDWNASRDEMDGMLTQYISQGASFWATTEPDKLRGVSAELVEKYFPIQVYSDKNFLMRAKTP